MEKIGSALISVDMQITAYTSSCYLIYQLTNSGLQMFFTFTSIPSNSITDPFSTKYYFPNSRHYYNNNPHRNVGIYYSTLNPTKAT